MQAKQSVILKQVAGQNMLIDMDENCVNFYKMITLNDTGVFIWDCLQSEIALADLVNKVSKEFDAPIEILQQDITQFVQKLLDMGLACE